MISMFLFPSPFKEKPERIYCKDLLSIPQSGGKTSRRYSQLIPYRYLVLILVHSRTNEQWLMISVTGIRIPRLFLTLARSRFCSISPFSHHRGDIYLSDLPVSCLHIMKENTTNATSGRGTLWCIAVRCAAMLMLRHVVCMYVLPVPVRA